MTDIREENLIYAQYSRQNALTLTNYAYSDKNVWQCCALQRSWGRNLRLIRWELCKYRYEIYIIITALVPVMMSVFNRSKPGVITRFAELNEVWRMGTCSVHM